MKVSELMSILRTAKQDADIELSVYGHTYNESHLRSHGGVGVYEHGHRVRISPGTYQQPKDAVVLGVEESE